MRRKVAITGATGFIGSHLVRRLGADGWQVRILTRQLPVHPHFGGTPVEAVIGSLDDEGSLRELVRDVDAVVHAAGLVKARSRAAFFEANAAGAARLVKVAAEQAATRQAGAPHFVLLSSLAAREPALSAYAASKRAGEAALTEATGLPWTIFRPSAVYGPGDRETLTFFRCIAKGVAPLLGSDQTRLSLIHVQDLAAAIALQLTRADTGAIYELDDGRAGGYSWREMIDVAADHFGRRPRTVRVPRPLLHAVALTNGLLGRLSGRSSMLTSGKVREIFHTDWVCHDQVFRTQSGWQPAVSLKQGFSGTIAWYQAQGWL